MTRPVIKWDDDEFGGFLVTKNLDQFIAPSDWVEDPVDASHFIPKYKPCKYRRLSFGTRQGRPWCHIHCLLFEEVVDHQTCIDCIDRVAPSQPITVESLFKDEDPVFSQDKPASRHVSKRNQPTSWVPCIHRQRQAKSDCGGCGTLVCGCEECPLLGQILSKKDCKECQHRTEN